MRLKHKSAHFQAHVCFSVSKRTAKSAERNDHSLMSSVAMDTSASIRTDRHFLNSRLQYLQNKSDCAKRLAT